MRAYGIDVSHYQLNIDWEKVAKTGKKFAIMKCQYERQSHRIDEYFERNYEGTGKYGIMRGVYLFVGSESIKDPVHDAQCLLNHLNGRVLEYGVWLDLESAALRAAGKNEITRLVNIYANIIRRAGYYVGIYTNLDWYRHVIDVKALTDYDIWLARYPKADNGTVHEGLDPKIGVAWQYSSKGRVDGIKGNVDLDLDYDGIIVLNNPKKSNEEIADEVIAGQWGSKNTTPTRKERLTQAGYNYYEVQQIVNAKLKV